MKKLVFTLLISLLALTGCSSPSVSTPDPTKEPILTPDTNENGVITADSWQTMYPEVYESYMKNQENDLIFDHVEEYPMIAVVYEGMAFNKYYNTARGHSYTLEDIEATGRPHALANCLACKSADYTAIVNDMGVEAYKVDFEEMLSKLEENVSCYDCHGNDVTSLEVTHGYLATAMGEDLSKIDAATLSCGQCHVEYYFDAETKEVILPYDSIEAMHPDKILAYFNEKEFSDYTNPRTGVKQIKVQHPEFETFMSEGSIHSSNMSCATCHMGETTAADGTVYMNHNWTSPLDNPELIENNCSACHTDLVAEVKVIQEETEALTFEVGYMLEDLTNQLAEKVATGNYSDEDLAEVRSIAREAQFYWDFVFVENSEGAHNSALSEYCLTTSKDLTNQALALVAGL